MRFKFGKRRVQICFIGTGTICTFFTKAIAHLEVEEQETDLTVWVIDQASSGVELQQPVWSWEDMDGHGNITTFPTGRYFANFQQVSNTFTLVDRYENKVIIWIYDIGTLPEWERSFPLRSVLYEWIKDSNYIFLHTGAIGTVNGCVMLTGRGGSGKSTSTLACLVALYIMLVMIL